MRVPSRPVLAVATALIGGAAVTTAAATTDKPDRRGAASAVLKNADGKRVGKAAMRESRNGTVQVTVTARGLTPGFHGLHVHEKGACVAPSQDPEGKTGAFLSAGGHIKAEGQTHGGHTGDLPSLFATKSGTARAAFVTDAFSVKDLNDMDGSALMVHTGRDNAGNIPDRYTSGGKPGPDAETQKTGDSGDRAACGVVKVRG